MECGFTCFTETPVPMKTPCIGCKATTALSTCNWCSKTNHMREVLITMNMCGCMRVRGAGMGYRKA